MPSTPNQFLKRLRLGALVFLLVMGVSCGGEDSLSVQTTFAISRGDLSVAFEANFPLAGYVLIDSKGDAIISANLPELRSGQIRISRSVRPHGTVLRFTSTNEKRTEVAIPDISEKAVIRSSFESAGNIADALILPVGSTTTLAVDLGDAATSAAMIRVAVEKPMSLISPEGLVSTMELPVTAGRYSVSGIQVVVAGSAESLLSLIKATILSAEGETLEVISREIAIRSLSELKSAVHIVDSALPADPEEQRFGGRREGFIDLGANAGGFGAERNTFPVTEQSVSLKSSLSASISVLVSARVETAGGKPAGAFDVPPGRPGPKVTAAAILPSNGQTTINMPFYADAQSARPGEYQRIITIKLAGSNAVLAEMRFPFEAGRSIDLALIVASVLSAITLLVFGWLLLRRSRVLDRFTTRQIVLAGLFSAASVVIVNIPVYFLTSITVFLLGPMGFLIDGLLSEFVFFALLTILVSIAPVQGICATVIGTRFLMGAVLLGMVTPVGILHAVTMGLILEVAVFLSRATRRRPNEQIEPGVGARLAVLFALGNTAVSWIGFQLAIVLFRLHYADWYIFLSVAIGGFVYALLGGLAGRTVGRKLAEAVP